MTVVVWFCRYFGTRADGSKDSFELPYPNGRRPHAALLLRDIRKAARAAYPQTVGQYDATEICMLHYKDAQNAMAIPLDPAHEYNVKEHGGDGNHPIVFRFDEPEGRDGNGKSRVAKRKRTIDTTQDEESILPPQHKTHRHSRRGDYGPNVPEAVPSFVSIKRQKTSHRKEITSKAASASSAAAAPKKTAVVAAGLSPTANRQHSRPKVSSSTEEIRVCFANNHRESPGNVAFFQAVNASKAEYHTTATSTQRQNAIVDELLARFDFFNEHGDRVSQEYSQGRIVDLLGRRRAVGNQPNETEPLHLPARVTSGVARKERPPRQGPAKLQSKKPPPPAAKAAKAVTPSGAQAPTSRPQPQSSRPTNNKPTLVRQQQGGKKGTSKDPPERKIVWCGRGGGRNGQNHEYDALILSLIPTCRQADPDTRDAMVRSVLDRYEFWTQHKNQPDKKKTDQAAYKKVARNMKSAIRLRKGGLPVPLTYDQVRRRQSRGSATTSGDKRKDKEEIEDCHGEDDETDDDSEYDEAEAAEENGDDEDDDDDCSDADSNVALAAVKPTRRGQSRHFTRAEAASKETDGTDKKVAAKVTPARASRPKPQPSISTHKKSKDETEERKEDEDEDVERDEAEVQDSDSVNNVATPTRLRHSHHASRAKTTVSLRGRRQSTRSKQGKLIVLCGTGSFQSDEFNEALVARIAEYRQSDNTRREAMVDEMMGIFEFRLVSDPTVLLADEKARNKIATYLLSPMRLRWAGRPVPPTYHQAQRKMRARSCTGNRARATNDKGRDKKMDEDSAEEMEEGSDGGEDRNSDEAHGTIRPPKPIVLCGPGSTRSDEFNEAVIARIAKYRQSDNVRRHAIVKEMIGLFDFRLKKDPRVRLANDKVHYKLEKCLMDPKLLQRAGQPVPPTYQELQRGTRNMSRTGRSMYSDELKESDVEFYETEEVGDDDDGDEADHSEDEADDDGDEEDDDNDDFPAEVKSTRRGQSHHFTRAKAATKTPTRSVQRRRSTRAKAATKKKGSNQSGVSTRAVAHGATVRVRPPKSVVLCGTNSTQSNTFNQAVLVRIAEYRQSNDARRKVMENEMMELFEFRSLKNALVLLSDARARDKIRKALMNPKLLVEAGLPVPPVHGESRARAKPTPQPAAKADSENNSGKDEIAAMEQAAAAAEVATAGVAVASAAAAATATATTKPQAENAIHSGNNKKTSSLDAEGVVNGRQETLVADSVVSRNPNASNRHSEATHATLAATNEEPKKAILKASAEEHVDPAMDDEVSVVGSVNRWLLSSRSKEEKVVFDV